MAFVEITPEFGVSLFAKADGFWLDWDKGSVEGNQRFLESIAGGRIEGLEPALWRPTLLCSGERIESDPTGVAQ
jgi:hypothetical protein